MTTGAPLPPPPSVGSVLLWHPQHGAYLHKGREGYTRRVSRAARVSPDEAQRIKAEVRHSPLEIEPLTDKGHAMRRPAPAPQRAALADLSDEELLRRAVLALAPDGGRARPVWSVVMDALVLNSAAAMKLCRRLNIERFERTDR